MRKLKDFFDKNTRLGEYYPHDEVEVIEVAGNYMTGRVRGVDFEVQVDNFKEGHGLDGGRINVLKLMDPKQDHSMPDGEGEFSQGVRCSYNRGWIIPAMPEDEKLITIIKGMFMGEGLPGNMPAPEMETAKEKEIETEERDEFWKGKLYGEQEKKEEKDEEFPERKGIRLGKDKKKPRGVREKDGSGPGADNESCPKKEERDDYWHGKLYREAEITGFSDYCKKKKIDPEKLSKKELEKVRGDYLDATRAQKRKIVEAKDLPIGPGKDWEEVKEKETKEAHYFKNKKTGKYMTVPKNVKEDRDEYWQEKLYEKEKK